MTQEGAMIVQLV